VTEQERRILGPLARSIRTAYPGVWSDLKDQTQFGPEFSEFPYYPAALLTAALSAASITVASRPALRRDHHPGGRQVYAHARPYTTLKECAPALASGT